MGISGKGRKLMELEDTEEKKGQRGEDPKGVGLQREVNRPFKISLH